MVGLFTSTVSGLQVCAPKCDDPAKPFVTNARAVIAIDGPISCDWVQLRHTRWSQQ
jgi:hypothetical protein